MSHARQAIDDGIGLVHDKVEKVGKGIGAGQYFFFFGGGGDLVDLVRTKQLLASRGLANPHRSTRRFGFLSIYLKKTLISR